MIFNSTTHLDKEVEIYSANHEDIEATADIDWCVNVFERDNGGVFIGEPTVSDGKIIIEETILVEDGDGYVTPKIIPETSIKVLDLSKFHIHTLIDEVKLNSNIIIEKVEISLDSMNLTIYFNYAR